MEKKPKTKAEIIAANLENAFSEKQIRTLISSGMLPAAAIHRPDDIEVFLRACNVTGANPLLKQAHMVPQKYKDKEGKYQEGFITVFDYRFKMAKASMSGQWGGFGPVTYNGGKSLSQCVMEGLKFPDTAEVTVYKIVNGQRFEAGTVEISWKEYGCPGKPTWQDKPFFMLGKVAKSHATSDAFPAEVGNMRILEEFDASEAPETVKQNDEFAQALYLIDAASSMDDLSNIERNLAGKWGNSPDFAKACNARKAEIEADYEDELNRVNGGES